MSLESKAKSPGELYGICLSNCKIRDCAKCPFASWVPLVDAQKEVNKFKTYRDNAAKKFFEAEDKIEAANNTLKQARDFIETIGEDKMSANHVLQLVSTLEETLHIPRKEEPNKDVCAICKGEFVGEEERTIDSRLRVMHSQCWRDETLKENTSP